MAIRSFLVESRPRKANLPAGINSCFYNASTVLSLLSPLFWLYAISAQGNFCPSEFSASTFRSYLSTVLSMAKFKWQYYSDACCRKPHKWPRYVCLQADTYMLDQVVLTSSYYAFFGSMIPQISSICTVLWALKLGRSGAKDTNEAILARISGFFGPMNLRKKKQISTFMNWTATSAWAWMNFNQVMHIENVTDAFICLFVLFVSLCSVMTLENWSSQLPHKGHSLSVKV